MAGSTGQKHLVTDDLIMDIRKLRYTLAVAREGSFTRAAQKVHISQSSISEQVKQLENIIGFEIFSRTGQGTELTDRGRIFLQEAERIYNELLGLSDVAKILQGEGETFAIAIASGLASLLVPECLSKFNKEIPDLRLEITTASTRRIFDQLHHQRIDTGIAVESDTRRIPAGLRQIRFLDTEMVLIVPVNHQLSDVKGAVHIERLVQFPIIMNEPDFGYGEVVRTLFEDLGLRAKTTAICDNVDTMGYMVEAGMGAAVVPRVCIEHKSRSHAYTIKEIDPVRSLSFSLIRRNTPMAKRKEKHFDFLLETLSNLKSN